jgi:hypothetical protein
MVNNVVQDLESVIAGIQELKNKYQHLSLQNKELQHQISLLKVETENKNIENIKIKEELERIAEVRNNSVVLTSVKPTDNVQEIADMDNNAKVKIALDGFIEEIDQCIQIIQAKE